ncbi:TQO small subunit DoxD [Parapedobacter sp. 10938]|uniref:TQO small subunit DoxD n=1 Tax=Parapedobacter flavus TaxID=3110225 RepID=UPI002DB5FE72|nr:TQO small subunit DoxD [Parapedobacter sp. 10938]MEC3881626.1 TQO small subunit DoxD [Parapedobacter sp. 10938]
MKQTSYGQPSSAGLFTLAIRLVIGWTYFSAFWRRLILENKLDPEGAGYIGEKFNHFLPNALGIQPIIEYLVTHPDHLHTAMVVFTIVEAVVGLFVMLGLFTRLMGIGVFGLAMGILLGSGWLGTTCLDEWQIGVLGVAGGFTLFLSGSANYSLDHYFVGKNLSFTNAPWFRWLGSGPLPLAAPHRFVLIGSLSIFALTLFTNQYFHGGVWGTLHNKSVRPKVELADVQLAGDRLRFQVYRTEGADVYGSFLIGIRVLTEEGETVFALDGDDLAEFPVEDIHNHYVAKVQSGAYSLVMPLGAKADLSISLADLRLPMDKRYVLELVDISGMTWQAEVDFAPLY